MEVQAAGPPGRALRYWLATLQAPGSVIIERVPYTVLVVSLLSYFLARVQQTVQGNNPFSPRLATWSGLVCVAMAVGILAVELIRKSWGGSQTVSSQIDRFTATIDKLVPTRLALSVHAWLVLLVIPVYASVWLSDESRQVYFHSSLLDKRWVVYGYLITVGAFLVLPSFFQRLWRASAEGPSTWMGLARAFVATPEPGKDTAVSVSPRVGNQLIKALFAVVLAACLFAPPWQIHQVKRAIDSHEMVHLGGLQAIDRGFLPYIGAASVHYGPGFQLLLYHYMKYTNQFSITGFRESFAFTHWLAATIFIVAVFLRFRLLLAVPLVFVAVLLPPLAFFQFTADGTMNGFYGWANGLRYLGAFLLMLFLPLLIFSRSGARHNFASSFCLGLAFAVSCYMAQENLTCGVLSALLLIVIVWLSDTCAVRTLALIVTGLTLGWTTFWGAVLGFYAYRGELWSFLDLYFLATRLFASGYANTPYAGGWQDLWGKAYYLLPVLVAAIGGAALYGRQGSGTGTRLGLKHLTILALALFCLVAHTGAMFRADSYHLTNIMIGFAPLAVCSIAYLPALISSAAPITIWSLRALIMVASVLLIPGLQWNNVRSSVHIFPQARAAHWSGPLHSAMPLPPDAPAAFHRVGAGLLDHPQCCSHLKTSMKDMAELMDELKTIVGDRATYVPNVSGMHPGHVYFFADLVPAPIYADRVDMIVNTKLLDRFLTYFRKDAPNIRAIISDDIAIPEIEIFKAAHPTYHVVQKQFESRPLYVLLAGDSADANSQVVRQNAP